MPATKRVSVTENFWAKLSDLKCPGETFSRLLEEIIEHEKKARLIVHLKKIADEGDFDEMPLWATRVSIDKKALNLQQGTLSQRRFILSLSRMEVWCPDGNAQAPHTFQRRCPRLSSLPSPHRFGPKAGRHHVILPQFALPRPLVSMGNLSGLVIPYIPMTPVPDGGAPQ
jgi:predicted CopG family antitoxin